MLRIFHTSRAIPLDFVQKLIVYELFLVKVLIGKEELSYHTNLNTNSREKCYSFSQTWQENIEDDRQRKL